MTDDASPLQYKEVRDYALVERVLRQRRLTIPTVVTLIASALAVALALYHVYVAGFGTPESHSRVHSSETNENMGYFIYNIGSGVNQLR